MADTMKSILVIDDEPLILYGLARVLQKNDRPVTTAASADAALSSLSAYPHDLVLLSLDMRDDAGLGALVDELATRPELGGIIMMSTGLPEGHKIFRRAIAAAHPGTSYCLVKPFDLYDAVLLVDQITKGESIDDAQGQDGAQKLKRRRKSARKSFRHPISFHFEQISEGKSERVSVEGESIDISATGLGLTTCYPLPAMRVISFGDEVRHQTGVVVWSEMVDDLWCRAGVRFDRPISAGAAL